MKNKQNPKKDTAKPIKDASEKATMDQNGKGNAPKYGQAGSDPSETKQGAKTGKL